MSGHVWAIIFSWFSSKLQTRFRYIMPGVHLPECQKFHKDHICFSVVRDNAVRSMKSSQLILLNNESLGVFLLDDIVRVVRHDLDGPRSLCACGCGRSAPVDIVNVYNTLIKVIVLLVKVYQMLSVRSMKKYPFFVTYVELSLFTFSYTGSSTM